LTRFLTSPLLLCFEYVYGRSLPTGMQSPGFRSVLRFVSIPSDRDGGLLHRQSPATVLRLDFSKVIVFSQDHILSTCPIKRLQNRHVSVSSVKHALSERVIDQKAKFIIACFFKFTVYPRTFSTTAITGRPARANRSIRAPTEVLIGGLSRRFRNQQAKLPPRRSLSVIDILPALTLQLISLFRFKA
jgi:hypothetical protein